MKRKTVIEILLQNKSGELFIQNLLEEQYEMAIWGEAESNEKLEDSVKRIVLEATGMESESFEIWHIDRCMGYPMVKKVIVCTVDGEKKISNAVEWIPRDKWKEVLESGKIPRNERRDFHDFFYQKGAAPEYFIDEEYVVKCSMDEMKKEVKNTRDLYGDDTKCVFAWYDLKKDEIPVYIWDEDLPERYLHRIISKNTRWTEDEELEFVSYANKKLDCEWVDSHVIYKAFKNKNPEWPLEYTQDWHSWDLLINIIYYLKGGASAILTKHRLEEIAQVLTRFSIPYNAAGENPSEILFDLPLPVLKALNSERGAKLLADEKMIRALKLFYQEAPKFFKRRLSNSKIYDLLMILEVKYVADELLAEAYEERVKKYAYEDERYKVIIPKTFQESFQYAMEMFHEYWKYMAFVVGGQTNILILVDKKKQNEKVAVLEIVENDMIDATGKYGMEPDEEIEFWLEKYVKEKNLKYTKFENEDHLPLPFD